ncbi:MAG: TlpA family protein disulfide reductase, partial [Bacteroidota bacterium]
TYVNFLLNYMDYKREADDLEFDPAMSAHEVNYELADDYLSGRSQYYIQALSVSRELHSGDLDAAMEMYDHYLANSPAEDYKARLEGAYETVQSLWAGNPAPDFTMTDIDGNTFSLSDYRGKVVYLKFWASWCPPCMRQVPHAAELKERMAGEDDLVFMYVSIDVNPEAWRNTVESHGISGVHARTPGRERGVPALYNVRWIPTFYIIGRDGNIFDHRPPVPADEDVDEVLREALHEEA